MAVRTDFVAGEVLAAQDLDDTFAAKIDYATPVNTQTGTTYTFVLADGLRLTTANNAAASTFTVPPQSSVVWLANSIIRLVNLGAGAVTINGGSGVTVTNTAATVAQFQSVDCIRTGSNAWTVVVAGGGDEPGLVHINTTTFSAVSSVSINNVFTSTFDSYKFIVNASAASGGPAAQLRLRASATDNTTSNYARQELFLANTTVSASQSTANLGRFGTFNTVNGLIVLEINAPFLSSPKSALSHSMSTGQMDLYGLLINLSSSFDGITFITGSSTITGTIRVYGYKNS